MFKFIYKFLLRVHRLGSKVKVKGVK